MKLSMMHEQETFIPRVLLSEATALSDKDAVALEQSIKHLQWAVMNKLRQFLVEMGLSKTATKHAVREPVPQAATAFDSLRTRIKSKMLQDVRQLSSLTGDGITSIEKYWGFKFPTSWSDAVSQSGMANTQGIFDQKLQQVVASVQDQDLPTKVRAIEQLAASI